MAQQDLNHGNVQEGSWMEELQDSRFCMGKILNSLHFSPPEPQALHVLQPWPCEQSWWTPMLGGSHRNTSRMAPSLDQLGFADRTKQQQAIYTVPRQHSHTRRLRSGGGTHGSGLESLRVSDLRMLNAFGARHTGTHLSSWQVCWIAGIMPPRFCCEPVRCCSHLHDVMYR